MNSSGHLSGLRVFTYRPRSCDVCGGDDLDRLWQQRHDVAARNGHYLFEGNVSICRRCGFVFMSPVYDQSELEEYYESSYGALEGARPDYDIDRRIAFLKSVGAFGGRYLEIGANRPSEFHARLAGHFTAVELVEPNSSLESSHRSSRDLDAGMADVVAHYFVLEHVAQVSEFLMECRRLLRSSGMMICEVPDLDIYPQDPTALQLHEHTNHFSQSMLMQIVLKHGFDRVAVSRADCSRPFGFVAAFRKLPEIVDVVKQPSEYEHNKATVLAGVSAMREGEMRWSNIAQQAGLYSTSGKGIIFWAANGLMALYLNKSGLPSTATIVDSNPQKFNFFTGRKVMTPEVARVAITAAEAIFIFTETHASDILADLRRDFGKEFAASHIHIVR
jgi:hypothetical protein